MNGTNGIYSWGSPTHFIIPNETYTCGYDDEMKSFIKLSNQLYFKLRNNQSGLEFLWKTSGDSIGTSLVKDLGTRKFCSNLIELNGSLFFMTTDYDPVWGNNTKELWKTDGTQNGTVVINNWVNSSNFSNDVKIVKYYNKIYFSGFESDGTSGGTIQTGLVLPPEKESCMYNGLIYYRGIDGKIWKSDGTLNGTSQAIDFLVVGNLYAFNGFLYFSGGYFGAGQPGAELCKSDGTLANTIILKDIYVGFNSSNPGNFISLNNYLFFIASDGIHGKELWKTDGTTFGTSMVKDIFPGIYDGFYDCYDGINLSHQIIFNNELYFSTHLNGDQRGVWKTDGSETNTILVQPADTVCAFLEINCKLFTVLDTMRQYNSGGGVEGDNSELWCLIDSCSSVGLTQKEEFNSLSIYPNPTSHSITIKGEKNMNQPFSIFDQMGREVFKGKLTGTETEVNLSMLSKGIYTLKIEGNYQPAQIVKE
jgi:ELWxxDGT repeat protein